MTEESGSIIGKGPVMNAPYPHGAGVAFLDYPGAKPPPDIGSDPFWTILPVKVTIDKDSLDNKWVKIIKSADARLVGLWCEYPRFQIDTPVPPPPTGKKYKVELTITGTITEA